MTNGIKNNPITARDVNIALKMLGKSKYRVEGKLVRNQPDAVITEYFPVPTSIFDYYKNFVLSVDVLFVNQIPFLASISKNIHYGTVKALDPMKIPVLEDEIKRVIRMYAVRGFHVEYMFWWIYNSKLSRIEVI